MPITNDSRSSVGQACELSRRTSWAFEVLAIWRALGHLARPQP
jgi:hypothetical protein